MFDPSLRYNVKEIRSQAFHVLNSEYFSALLEEIPNVILVINDARQVVYANRNFIEQLGIQNDDDIWGQRPGECFDCVRATMTPDGCSSTAFCKVCGFANAISNSEQGNQSIGECSIVVKSGDTLSYSVITKPFFFNDQQHIFCFLQDISEKRAHEFLERTFLHDIQNSVSVLYAMHDILEDLSEQEIKNTIRDLSVKLNEEINSYRLISNAENNSLSIRPEDVNITEMADRTRNELLNIKTFRNKQILLKGESIQVYTDKTLLRRILLNLIKNALEASKDDEPIEIILEKDVTSSGCHFHVKSLPVISEENQLQIFQKSFSTKGRGRGWGTYSIRLLTVNYLHGAVSFVSDEINRTVFTVTLPSLNSGVKR